MENKQAGPLEKYYTNGKMDWSKYRADPANAYIPRHGSLRADIAHADAAGKAKETRNEQAR